MRRKPSYYQRRSSGGSGNSAASQIQLTGNSGFRDPLDGWRIVDTLNSVSGTRNLSGSINHYLSKTYGRKSGYFDNSARSVANADLLITGDKTFLCRVDMRSQGVVQAIVGCGGDGSSLAQSYLYQLALTSSGELEYAHQTGFGPSAFYRHSAPAIVNTVGQQFLGGVVGFAVDTTAMESHLIYNGVIIDTKTFSTAPSGGSAGAFSLGKDAGFSTAYAYGLIGEAWIWDDALPADEILAASAAITTERLL